MTHTTGGGVWSVARFLIDALDASSRYEAQLILLATSASDPDSVRLLSPQTWRRPLGPRQALLGGRTCWHVGAQLPEFEFQRYRPRQALRELLRPFDLIQVVAGAPAWAAAAAGSKQPVCLFAATLAREERASLVRSSKGWRRLYWPMMNTIVSRIERQALANVDYVFAESFYTKDLLSRYVPAGRLGLGVPGVDTALFCPSSTSGLHYILSVGRFDDRRKNVRLTIDAYRALKTQHPEAPRLLLAGSAAPPKEELEYAASVGLSDCLEVKTNLSLTQLVGLYQDAVMFLLSSDEEGLGLVILEAMACGLPVVSTDCGGPSTAVLHGQTGYLTPVGDPMALAEAMARLLSDSALGEEFGRNGRARAESAFSLEAAGSVYLRKYDELLG